MYNNIKLLPAPGQSTLCFIFVEEPGFVEMAHKVLDSMKNGHLLTQNSKKYAYHTYWSYKSAVQCFMEFEKFTGYKILMSDMCLGLMKGFQSFLTINQNLALNTVCTKISRIKNVLAHIREIMPGYYSGEGMRVGNELTNNVYTDFSELQKMLDTDLSKRYSLFKVRNAYVIQSMLGLRFSDLKKFLENPDLYLRYVDGATFLIMNAQKTNRKVVVPVAKIVLHLLEKTDFSKFFCSQYYNRFIKVVGRLAGIDQKFVKIRTIGGIRTEMVASKYHFLSSHSARRSCATNAVMTGVPETLARFITGHKDAKAFARYIQSTELQIAKKLQNESFFTILDKNINL
jgi:hypothetical protein